MQKIKDSVRRIKDDLYTMQGSSRGEDIDRIMEIENLSDSAKKEFILLFSNLKEEIRDLKSYQLVTLSKISDGVLDMAERIEGIAGECKGRQTLMKEKIEAIEEKQNKGILQIIMSSTLYKTIAGAMAFIIFLVILHALNPNSTSWAGGLVKDLFGTSKSISEGDK